MTCQHECRAMLGITLLNLLSTFLDLFHFLLTLVPGAYHYIQGGMYKDNCVGDLQQDKCKTKVQIVMMNGRLTKTHVSVCKCLLGIDK